MINFLRVPTENSGGWGNDLQQDEPFDAVRTGKVIVLEVAGEDEERVRALVTEACEKLLANPVIEQYSIEF